MALLISKTVGEAGLPFTLTLTPLLAIAFCRAADEEKIDGLPEASSSPREAAVSAASVALLMLLMRKRTRTERSMRRTSLVRGDVRPVTGTPRRLESSSVLIFSVAAASAEASRPKPLLPLSS